MKCDNFQEEKAPARAVNRTGALWMNRIMIRLHLDMYQIRAVVARVNKYGIIERVSALN